MEENHLLIFFYFFSFVLTVLQNGKEFELNIRRICKCKNLKTQEDDYAAMSMVNAIIGHQSEPPRLPAAGMSRYSAKHWEGAGCSNCLFCYLQLP